MLKREIKYEDFDGNEVTDTFYFNLTKSEIIELEVEHEGGLEQFVNRISKANDHKALIAEFKKIILASYGEKSVDGKRFIKSDQLRDEFSQTAAYDALFIELATNDDAAVKFIQGVLPKDMSPIQTPDKPTSPPQPPVIRNEESI